MKERTRQHISATHFDLFVELVRGYGTVLITEVIPQRKLRPQPYETAADSSDPSQRGGPFNKSH